jgi:hypothetical protein
MRSERWRKMKLSGKKWGWNLEYVPSRDAYEGVFMEWRYWYNYEANRFYKILQISFTRIYDVYGTPNRSC